MFSRTPDPVTGQARVLDDLLRATVQAHPDAPAIGPMRHAIDFRTLDSRVNRVAAGLIAGGAVGDRVAILGRNSAEQVELLLGCARADQVALPINWRLTAKEVAYILGHSGAGVLFVDREFADTARAALEGRDVVVRLIDGDGAGDFAAWRDSMPADPVVSHAVPVDPALQMYTSGTTGLPKAVVLTHANVMASIAIFSAPPMDLGVSDVIYAPAPMFHITGIGPVLRSAQSGARLVLSHSFIPDEAVRTMAEERVSYTTLAPAMIQACLTAPAMTDADLSRLRIIVYGGSPIAESVLSEAQARIGCEFAQCYGLTETTGPITLLAPADHVGDAGLLLSCGRAVAPIEIAVVAPDGSPVAPGETGEIIVHGPVVMAGYGGDPLATHQTIRDGWLYTGDAGYLDANGYLFIRDRVKDMIVSGGENIYPVEVENALIGHPAVRDVAVIGVPHPKWGESVLALVVGAGATEGEAILDFCRQQIAAYKCPREIRFVDAIPRNAAGKILRRELRKPYWEGRDRMVG